MPASEFCHASLGFSYPQALSFVLTAVLGSGLSLWGATEHLHLAPGARLAAVAPVLGINLLLPKLFCRWDETVSIILISFTCMLASLKAVAWALGRGPLCTLRFTPLQFMAAYATPITPLASSGAPATATEGTVDGSGSGGGEEDVSDNTPSASAEQPPAGLAPSTSSSTATRRGAAQVSDAGEGVDAAASSSTDGAADVPPAVHAKGRQADDAGSWSSMAATWGGKLLFTCFIVWLLQFELPLMLRSLAYGLGLYSILCLIMDGPAALVIGLTGLRVSPHFDRPWRATTLASFWSKRWDLAAGNALRLVYDVVCDGSLLLPAPGAAAPGRPGAARQLAGSAGTFFVSGVLHELIFWYLTGHTSGGAWLAFFLVQVPLLVGERLILGVLKGRGIMLPDWLRAQAVMNTMLPVSYFLFWRPCERAGVTQSAVSNVRDSLLAGMEALQALRLPA